ncbi:uncharacterized protein LOC109861165 [Pseudomyrmex gracilis]|uniref:uncharacterized protein LOC109861165 n=1 Tax=Pseudomyrmex gracilis TaxID=219809 RepID=UPI000995A5A9|nr:uncharacterized protein LOC109861165 [Pseudomyrmex gracilis]
MSNEENPAVLKKQRAVIKGSCTRINTYVEAITSPTPMVVAQLEERKKRLDSCWSEYNQVQTRLEMLDEAEGEDRFAFEEAFYALSAKIRGLLSSPVRSADASLRPVTPHEPQESLTHVRLPKLDLPSFSGKYDEWFPFFDVFNTVIHSNASLSKVQKFQYLRASLTNEAKNIVNSLEISNANYDVAWKLLKERYDNQRVIVQNHIKAIMELPLMNKENYAELRQIADGAARHLHALQALKRPVDQWDDLLIHVLSSKLDPRTLREWQSSLTGTELPNLKQFFAFLTHQCQMLEATDKSSASNVRSGSIRTRSQSSSKQQASCVATVKSKCSYCQGEHSIYYCRGFLGLSVSQRISEARSRKMCLNCLRSSSHDSSKCTSGSCKVCQAKHNTLLHATATPANSSDHGGDSGERPKAVSQVASPVTSVSSLVGGSHVMLSTAIVYACDSQGSLTPCRALLDCGSQANFMSKSLANRLRLKPEYLNVSISGISGTAATSTQVVQVRIQSRLSSYTNSISCIVTDRVTERLPAFTLKRRALDLPRNLRLADPQFHVSSEVDLLLGADVFWDLLCVGQIKASNKHPTLQKTLLGWVIAGRFCGSTQSPHKVHSCHAAVTNVQLHEQLSRFWQLDHNFEQVTSYTINENLCEQHFLRSVTRNPQGRFVVKLPIKEQVLHKLGGSYDIALKRLRSLERRFQRDTDLKDQYTQFIKEYLALGHMRLLDSQPVDDSMSCYLPHHCVYKVTSQSRKLRVVFDASCKTSSGVSLNDALMVGPVVQQDLMSILIRFRSFRYVFTADIVKMYRQVLLDPSQTRLQRILWRDDPNDRVDAYELNTITYGTSSASYLATRCLLHLAEQHSSQFPVGANRVKRDFYMDDLLTGADSLSEAKLARDEIIGLLRLGLFELSKWASSCPELLEGLDDQNRELVVIKGETDSCILGIQWNQVTDTFHFSYELSSTGDVASKRMILSEIARLFDPLGLLGPVVVVAKIILQDLWQAGVQWDESAPQEIHTRWSGLKSQLTSLNQVQVPRGVKFRSDPHLVQLHGFCDASQRAYGACVYVRTRLGLNEWRSELLCSRSRVAPLKAVSLPRLELSAALLLARLVVKVGEALSLTSVQVFLWSDSTITLNWIASPSRRWTVFVANRVGEIQRLTEAKDWRHVASHSNPADHLSRGLDPHELSSASLWWHGPSFLQAEEEHWPDTGFQRLKDGMPEQRAVVATVAVIQDHVVNELLVRVSGLNRACRILAYCLRFLKARRPTSPTRLVSHEEAAFALNVMCKTVQALAFPGEVGALTRGDNVNARSNILSLAPFVDEGGLLRVGGRLRNSGLQFDACHPVLLPRSHTLTLRIVEHEHLRNMHAGTQATMAAVRQRFWPLSLRSTTRRVIQRCVPCSKVKPRMSEAIMGALPAGRVTVSRPFSHCGVDYAGPVVLREGKRRNAKNHKAYVSVFVCFATRAVHLELVSDLTSDAFIGAFKRFISRRGRPSHMYSDNGTTFVGARGQLKELYSFYCNQQTQSDVERFLCEQEISWNFIPPNAPHFGGLWEAAVKSAKHHLARVVGKAHLTFEEMQTVLSEIEAILNSRPLTPLSADPNDLAYLSPGHFLVGTALNSFPCRDLNDVNENRLVRWQRVEQIRQHFWRRWSAEYLHSLQERHKWKNNKGPQLTPGQVVLVKQQNLAPLQWTLGRIQEVHPGPDGVARSATVKTAKGVFVRPLSRIAVLPLDT